MKPISVLLADDHIVVREGLRMLLEAEGDIKVVGEAETGRQAVRLVQQLRPAVVVMDIAMPKLNGVEATRQILKLAPSTKVLILSAHSDDAYIEEVFALGAVGYLVKQSSGHVLAKALREAEAGHTFFSPSIAKRLRLVDGGSSPRANLLKHQKTGLSSRERQVLQLIAEGMSNKEAAAELGIGLKTVEKHREHLIVKLDIHDTAGLTRYAINAGVIESNVHLTLV